jgi:hypothetical protein
MLKRVAFFFTIVLMLLLLVSCSGGSYKITIGEIKSTETEISGEYEGFSGHYFKNVKLKRGENLIITFSEQTEDGEIVAKVLDASGEQIGIIDAERSFNISETGQYTLQVEGKNHRGKFVLKWIKE